MGAGASSINRQPIGKEKCREARKVPSSAVVNDQESLEPSGYRLIKTIGKGSYGKVKRAFSRKHGRDVAIKIIDRDEKNELHHARFFRREKQVTFVANHRNIVKCFEILECRSRIYIILEYMNNGDLCRFVIISFFFYLLIN